MRRWTASQDFVVFEVWTDVLREAQVALPAASAYRIDVEPQAFPLRDLRKLREKSPVAFRRLRPIGRTLIVGISAGDGQLGAPEIFLPPIQEVFFQSYIHPVRPPPSTPQSGQEPYPIALSNFNWSSSATRARCSACLVLSQKVSR